jgi:two-component system KDP operon response regulator KdpE
LATTPSDAGASVLVIEDDESVATVLELAFTARGYAVAPCATGVAGMAAASELVPDVVVLDLGLPDVDGIDVCRQLRRWYANPILVLTADGDEDRKVTALDAGADDYVTKPFSMGEVLARMRVALRHRKVLASVVPHGELTLGPLVVDPDGWSAVLDGRPLALRPREFDLLLLLARNVGKVLTHGHLAERIWGDAGANHVESLRWHVMQLRKKLGASPGAPSIETLAGVGYRLRLAD